ncbi:DUF1080 domain-containing protein [Arenibacter sp. F20364]|uniref:3-keto-disaccharide hydrolase n=1 Tax=Arenibacter sp. F20364 TaxID=2926415 RepID=UPI001FF440F5|nr:DUF1080 domain-containing protein [Arenibacter sp. F20364]MCK0190273.1 DUF1080 domain-containing protein [Arenibacter sp. F20364]
MKIPILFGGLLLVLISCGERKTQEVDITPEKPLKIKDYLPFTAITLDDLSAFKAETDNWQIVKEVYVDRSLERTIETTPGVGALVNQPNQNGKNGHIFTSFEHGDIEIEVDVMMPVNSNSGIYFQGRYEVQLLDSWGVKEPTSGDMGGIYQRWDDARGKGNEKFEGHSPKINASKSPGLWQHYKIIFHAPRFDKSGSKIKNAIFQEVWLNGVLIQENVEVTGPTRAASFEDEKLRGPLMIQGDHGPVALRNIKYKLYEDKTISLSDMMMTEYESNSNTIARLDTLTVVREINTDSISAKMVTGDRVKRVLKYQGNMNIPNSGTYLFDYKVNNGGGLLLIDNDTIVNLNGSYSLKEPGIAKVELLKGIVPFTFIYNKHNPWNTGFGLEVEGPEIQKLSLAATGSLSSAKRGSDDNIVIDVRDEVAIQRGYMMHKGEKRTHCIAVGTPEHINFSYDLNRGSILKVWQGNFLDVTQMWHARGIDQLAEPKGFSVSFHGNPDFMILEDRDTVWPDSIPSNIKYRQLGYEIEKNGLPVFLYQVEGTAIKNSFKSSESGRGLNRSITINGKEDIWHKMAEGESIQQLQDDTFIVNDESYFIDFSGNDGLVPVIRHSNGRDELLLKIPAGDNNINYNIIW